MNEAQTPIFYEFGDFRIDAAKRLLLRRDGERVPLTPKAFETLLYLVQHSGTVLDKDELLQAVWADTVVEENNLNQHISTLRRVLGERRDEHRYIVTVPGRGYRFIAEVSTENAESQPTPPAAPMASSDKAQTASPDEARANGSQVDASPLQRRAGRSSRRVRLGLLVGVLALGLSVVAFYFWRGRGRTTVVTPIRTIAVLPFKPLVAENRDEALEIGMADTLIARLSNSREIVVRPLSSVRKYGGLEQDPLAAGRELGVEAVLEGSIQKSSDRLRINARLIGVADGTALWTGTFDEKLTDVFTTQDSISERVAGALALRLSDEERKRLTRRYTDNAEAYQLYLRGRFHLLKLRPAEIQKGIASFQQAIELDPSYALAYAGLADTYRAMVLSGDQPPAEYFPRAKAAAQQAIRLDDSLAEAHAALGFAIFFYDWDWNAAEEQYKQALALNPNSADTHQAYANLLSVTGRHAEGLAETRRARELDPLDLRTSAFEGLLLVYAGRPDEALLSLQKTLELDPTYWISHLFAASAYIDKGRYAEAIAAARRARELSGVSTQPLSYLAYALAKSGQQTESRAVLEEMLKQASERYVPAYNIALAYEGLGERDQALAWLERGVEQRDARMVFLKVEPKWNPLRADPRFADILRRVRLAP